MALACENVTLNLDFPLLIFSFMSFLYHLASTVVLSDSYSNSYKVVTKFIISYYSL